MDALRRAACSCGQLTVEARGEPARVSVCHCTACQRRTGSAFGAQARFAEADVTVAGRRATYVRVADSGNTVRFSFCPECGATVCWTLDGYPGVVAVALGAFVEGALPTPTVEVYEERRRPWVELALAR